MPSNFPGAIDNIANNKTDNTSAANDHAPHHNDLADAIINIQNSLGVNLANVANATNLATGTVPTARLASGTANSTTFLAGNSVWATISASVGGANTQVQFNDSTSANGSAAFTFDKSTNVVSVGNSTVNVSINSTAFSGTANNASNLGGSSLATIQGQITGNASTAYANAVANAAALYQTTAGLAANVATLTANNSNNLGGIPSANYALLSATTSVFTGNIVANNANTTNNLNVGGDLTVQGNVFVTGGVVSLLGNTITFVDNMIFLNQGIFANITNISGNGTVVTFTANNNYQVGWDVFVANVTPSSYNGNYLNIIAANATHFQVSNTNTDAYVSNGTARGKTDFNPDLGLSAAYNDGTYQHTGIFRDASDGFWKVFDGYLPEPDASVFIDTSNASFNIANFHAGTIRLGNTTVYGTVNTTIYSGTANNSNNLNGQPASFYTNATNITTGTLPVAQLPANIVFWSNTNSFSAVQTINANLIVNSAILSVGNSTVNVSINSTAFSGIANNSINLGGSSLATIQSEITGNAATAYSNAVANAAALYQTTAGLSANVATLTSNNSTNLNGQPASFYTNATNITTGTLAFARLPANIVFWSNTNTFTAVQTFNQNVFINSATLSVGNTTANITANTTELRVGNSTVNVSINSTAFSGTSSNATNLNSQPASFYTNATNLATGTVPTARLASGTANSTTFLAGNSVWATIVPGVGGSNQEIQFNDSNTANGSAALTFNKSTNNFTLSNGNFILSDGAAFETVIQAIPATANQVISFPDATGVVGLVAGSNTQIPFNSNGSYGASANLTFANNVLSVGGSILATAGQPITSISANSYTLAATDTGKIVEFSNTDITILTIANNATTAIPTGAQIAIVQLTANGTVQVANAAGVTISSRGGLANTAGEFAVAWLYKRSTDAWILTGDIS